MGPLDYLGERASAQARVRLLSSGMTADGVSVYLIDDGKAKVLQVSPEAFPDVVRKSLEKIQEAREVLGCDLGAVIPVPLDRWELNGISCALFEELTPISRRRLQRAFQLNKLKPPVLAWLRQIASIDRGPAKDAELGLQALTRCPYPWLRAAANDVLEKIGDNHSSLKARLMHGDMTLGNVMLDPSRSRDFMIIDWGGSNIDGFPIFDLVKFAEAVRLPTRRLRTELAAHAEILGCDVQETRSYLTAALGHIWMHLEQFPPERFAVMAKRNLNTLNGAING